MNQKALIIGDDALGARVKNLLDGAFEVHVAEGELASPDVWHPEDFTVVVATISPLATEWFEWGRQAAATGGPGWVVVGGAKEAPEGCEVLAPFILETFPDEHAFLGIVLRASEIAEIRRENVSLEAELTTTMGVLEEVAGTLVEVGGKDTLTGLLNRGQLMEHLAVVAATPPFSVLFLDVDHLSNFNEIHGREEGDDLLQQLADVLASRYSRIEGLARYGGDEFVVVLPGIGCQDALVEAEELRRHLMNFPFFGRETQPLGVITVSIGVATFPDDASDPARVIAAAECGAYLAKRISRNSVFRPD